MQNWIITLVFEKNAIFFAKNWQTSQKIVIITSTPGQQGCQMVYFQTPNILEGFGLENVGIFNGHWNILQKFGMFYDNLVHFAFFWYILSGVGIVYQEKSGNPVFNMVVNEKEG
jgi:hypothetical protein